MDIERLRKLELGEEVTVITKGQYQIVDVANDIKIPPLTECTVKLTPFIENSLRQGTLTLTSEDEAPKASGKSKNEDELKYTGNNDTEVPLRVAGGEEAPQNSSTGNEALTSESARPRRSRGGAEANKD